MNQLWKNFTTSTPAIAEPVPLLDRADHSAPSVFRPENLLREARRQKGLGSGNVPAICVLDPDGDIVEHVRQRFGATKSPDWACYHTRLWQWECDGVRFGIVGFAVGGSFSVLVAEQLFACGCQLLVSIASAGQITHIGPPPYHVLITRALRDEGTSYHYLPASPYALAAAALITLAEGAFINAGHRVYAGTTWTTDAPFRETEETIMARRRQGILTVEMEAAVLYAFGEARNCPVICLAQVSNQLGCVEGDFEKGDLNGAAASISLVIVLSQTWSRSTQTQSALPYAAAIA